MSADSPASTPGKPGVRRLTVSAEESGEKLVHFLARKLPGLPRSALMRVIRTGEVRVDGRRAKPFDALPAGAEIRVPPLSASSTERPPAAALPIVFEGLELLVIDKPSGLASQPGTGLTDSVVDRLKALYAGRAFAPQIVHRLDRDASGLLLAGTTHTAVRRLNELFRDKTETARTSKKAGACPDKGPDKGMDKVYLAWILGRLRTPREGLEVRDRLERVREAGEHRAARGGGAEKNGKEAVAWVRAALTRKIARPGQPDVEVTLVAVRLGTGRLHQIRAQLGLRGHPLIGDALYGGPKLSTFTPAKSRLLLHAWRLCLPNACFSSLPDWPPPFAIGEAEQARLRGLE